MNFLIIDEEGFPLVNERRLKDDAEGRFILSNAEISPEGNYRVTSENLMNQKLAQKNVSPLYLQAPSNPYIHLEPFDVPFVIKHVSVKTDSEVISAVLAHGFKFDFHPRVIWVDEWDRFRGHTKMGVPFVLSRTAQMEFFDLMDEFDDDSITWHSETLKISSKKDLLKNAEFKGQLGSEVHSALVDMIPRLKMPRSRILSVIHEGETDFSQFFAKDGHISTTKTVKSGAGLERTTLQEEYDFIFVSREALRPFVADLKIFMRSMKNYLAQKGTLFVVADVAALHKLNNFVVPELTEWELRESVRKDYDFLFWGRWKLSPEPWPQKELFFYAQKK